MIQRFVYNTLLATIITYLPFLPLIYNNAYLYIKKWVFVCQFVLYRDLNRWSDLDRIWQKGSFLTRKCKRTWKNIIYSNTDVEMLPVLYSEAARNGICWLKIKIDDRLKVLGLLFEKILCVPATSAPVEQIFSHGGLFMRPNRARLGQTLLSELVFTKCNKHLK